MRNNLWEGSQEISVLMLGPIDGVKVDHNTALGMTRSAIFAGNAPNSRFVLTNKLLGQSGIVEDSVRPGNEALAMYCPGALVQRNMLIGFGGSSTSWTACRRSTSSS